MWSHHLYGKTQHCAVSTTQKFALCRQVNLMLLGPPPPLSTLVSGGHPTDSAQTTETESATREIQHLGCPLAEPVGCPATDSEAFARNQNELTVFMAVHNKNPKPAACALSCPLPCRGEEWAISTPSMLWGLDCLAAEGAISCSHLLYKPSCRRWGPCVSGQVPWRAGASMHDRNDARQFLCWCTPATGDQANVTPIRLGQLGSAERP